MCRGELTMEARREENVVYTDDVIGTRAREVWRRRGATRDGGVGKRDHARCLVESFFCFFVVAL